jgi:hypothetical protein
LMSSNTFRNVVEVTNNLFIEHILLIKMRHFQTKSFAEHKVLDKYLTKFLENYDLFMEVAQGKYGRLRTKEIHVNASTLEKESIVPYLRFFLQALGEVGRILKKDADLLTIRDQIAADTDQLLYLLTFE